MGTYVRIPLTGHTSLLFVTTTPLVTSFCNDEGVLTTCLPGDVILGAQWGLKQYL